MANLPSIRTEGNNTSSELIQLVSFKLENEEYGIEVLKVREIIRMIPITHMPNTAQCVEGIINLRGKIIPVVSMRKKFGLMEQESDSQTRIVVMDINNELTGFIVDSVSEVIRISGSEIQPPPNVVSGGIDQECITGVINQTERLLVLLDLERLFSHEEKAFLLGI
jgi:purine-binding chemotaxis protein CheW